jgi:hypothetical protein
MVSPVRIRVPPLLKSTRVSHRPAAGRAGFSAATTRISLVGRWYALTLEYLEVQSALKPNLRTATW